MASTHKSRVSDMTQGAPVFFSIFSHFGYCQEFLTKLNDLHKGVNR